MLPRSQVGTVAGAAGAGLAWLLAGPAAGAEPASEAWLARAQREIAAREYHASTSAEGLQAPNRAHDLRSWFTPTGIRVHDRAAPGSPELLSLSLAGIGRGEGGFAPLGAGRVSSQGARVEIRREGLLEWYENSPAGLEQGFEIEARPAGEGPLVLELALTGAEATAEGDGVVFASAAGRRLRYGELRVLDAAGRVLAAHLEVPAAGRLHVVIEDGRQATYPVTVDPLLTGIPDAQLESNQANAQLGSSVSGAGDVNGDGYDDVIVGANRYEAGQTEEGAAFVFLGSAFVPPPSVPSLSPAGVALLGGLLLWLARSGFARRRGVPR